MKALRLGTRGSQLALVQAGTVAERLSGSDGPACEIVVIKTSGDRLAEAPLAEIGGKRLFVKEIEEALLGGEIDLAVHSSKDMAVVLPAGLMIGAVLPREDPRDVLVLPDAVGLQPESLDVLIAALGPSPRVGTSSVRRVAQLRRLWPDAVFQPVRGNLETRLRKLDDGEYDVLVLAAAGIRRLGASERISLALPISACVPAPGQGAIAVEIRAGDGPTAAAVRRIDDDRSSAAVCAERAFVERLGGGCQTPVGAVALPIGDDLELQGIVVSIDGTRILRQTSRGSKNEAAALGVRAAVALIEQGAMEILDTIRDEHARVQGIQP